MMEIKKVAKDFLVDEEKSKENMDNIQIEDEKLKLPAVHSDKKKGCKNCDGLCCQKKKSHENRAGTNDKSNISS